MSLLILRPLSKRLCKALRSLLMLLLGHAAATELTETLPHAHSPPNTFKTLYFYLFFYFFCTCTTIAFFARCCPSRSECPSSVLIAVALWISIAIRTTVTKWGFLGEETGVLPNPCSCVFPHIAGASAGATWLGRSSRGCAQGGQ